MKNLRLFLSQCLLAVLVSSCSSPATSAPGSTLTAMPTSLPTAEPTPSPPPPPFRIIAYVTAATVESVIPYDQLTHINYAFLIPNADGSFNPIANAWNIQQIAANAHAHHVQVLISVGGWGWDAQFEEMASKAESRAAFVNNLVAFVNQFQLDGADIDWEYPDPGQSAQNFLALITELRAAMPGKLLTSAVIAYGDDMGLGIPAESFAAFDLVNIMTYAGSDHGSMGQFNRGLEYWRGRGLPKEKMVIGVPFYSEPGELSFAKLVDADPSAAQVDEFDYYGSVQRYNGIPTIQAKTEIAMREAGGVMFWALEHDALGEYSLVNAIYAIVNQK